jgi:hypothetical protein
MPHTTKSVEVRRPSSSRALSNQIPSGISRPAVQVLQRKQPTKNDIFEDQVKWIVVQGIAKIVNENSGSEAGRELALKLENSNLIKINSLIQAYKTKSKNQIRLLKEEKDGLLGGVTLQNLQENNLVLEAATAAELSTAKWELYKTEVDDNGKAKGFEGETEGNNQKVKTTIRWKGIVNGQGRGVTAKVLGPDHPLGSVPSHQGIKDKVNQFSKAANNKKYIAGHLLNNNLGGPGNDAQNLTAIPADVNSEMSVKIEDKVIERVNKDHQVVYYDVKVDYANDGQHDYASKLTIIFGSYKSTTDFSQPDPDNDLEERYTFTLPINKPADYGQATGYTATNQGYRNQSGQTFPRINVNPVNNPAKLKFNKPDDIVLKDATQIKLEFIAAAIYSLPIRELQKQIEQLVLEKGESEDAFDALAEKQKELTKEVQQLGGLKQQLQQIEAQYKQEREGRIAMEEWSQTLEEEKKNLDKMVHDLKEDIGAQNKLAERLTAELEEYKFKARERAENLGFEVGFEDGLNGKGSQHVEQRKTRRISLGSTEPFDTGYAKGWRAGNRAKLQAQRSQELEEEVGSLRKENESLSKEKESLKGENEVLKKENERLRTGYDLLKRENETLKVSVKQDEKVKEVKKEHTNVEPVQLPGISLSTTDEKPKKTEKKQPEKVDEKDEKKSVAGEQDRDKDSEIKTLFQQIYNTYDAEGGSRIKPPLYKYEYLAILIHLKIIRPSEAYDAYPNVPKYNEIFIVPEKCKYYYREFRKEFK